MSATMAWRLVGIAALCLASMLTVARADEQPLWEFGMGVGGVVFNDYRGSATAHGYPVPVPYFIYRGRFLQADRNGVHSRFLNLLHLELEVSGNATAPVFSRHNAARQGMPNLASTIELGPSLTWHAWHSDDRRLRFDVHAPVRNAITLDSPVRSIGWVFNPTANVDYTASGRLEGWNFGLQSGPLYQQEQYNNYFYGVAPRYQTAERPTYRPPGGYAGSEVLISTSKRYRRYWVGAYLRHDWLSGAVFDPSPLVQTRSYWAGGVGFVWILQTSSTMVATPEGNHSDE
jgi:MipA family protein